MKDKTFLTLAGIFFILFFLAIIGVAFNERISQILIAKDTSPSPLKSFGIVFPQVGMAGTKIKVSIYIRDVTGGLLPGREVKLTTDNSNVVITPFDVQKTNDIGLAEFFITSQQAGTVKLIATELASSIEVANIPTVEFTQ